MNYTVIISWGIKVKDTFPHKLISQIIRWNMHFKYVECHLQSIVH